MGFFTAPYRVHPDDVSAFGGHQYLVNARYQVAVWERFLTDEILAEHPHARDEFEAVALAYEDQYNRVLAPVRSGERVAVLISFEELEARALRVCFRVLDRTGRPVACGFRRVMFVARATDARTSCPPSLAELLRANPELREEVGRASFAERAVAAGPVDDALFPDPVRSVGKTVAAQPEEPAPRRRSTTAVRLGATTPAPVAATGPGPAGEGQTGMTFVFPGPESYDGRALRELYDYLPHLVGYFEAADRVAREHLGRGFMPLVHAPSLADHDERLRRFPDLTHLGVFLTGVLLSEALKEKAVRPALVMGHGLGELTALAVAGVVDVSTGLEIAVRRVLALRAVPDDVGGMLALACDAARAGEVLASLSVGAVTVAVRHHAHHTVVAGPRAELERVEAEASRTKLSPTWLDARHALHSPLLMPAAERLKRALKGLTVSAPLVQVHSPIAGALCTPQSDYADALASHLVRPVDFEAAVRAARAAGTRVFVECGAAGVLTAVIRRILPDEPSDAVLAAIPPNASVASGLRTVANARAGGGAPAHPRQR